MSSDIATEANVVLLDPELAQVFPDSKSVNDVLRAILAAAMRTGTRGADDLRPKAVVWGAAGRRRSCSANRKHRIVVAGIEAFQLITASDINRISTRRLRKEITQLILIFRTQLRANEVVDIVGIGLIEPCRWSLRDSLIDEGLIEQGRGRGGSVRRSVLIASPDPSSHLRVRQSPSAGGRED